MDVLHGDHHQYSQQLVQQLGLPGRHTLDARYALGFLYQRNRNFCVAMLQGKQIVPENYLVNIIGNLGQHSQLRLCAHPAI
jgi:hypothetical protein